MPSAFQNMRKSLIRQKLPQLTAVHSELEMVSRKRQCKTGTQNPYSRALPVPRAQQIGAENSRPVRRVLEGFGVWGSFALSFSRVAASRFMGLNPKPLKPPMSPRREDLAVLPCSVGRLQASGIQNLKNPKYLKP